MTLFVATGDDEAARRLRRRERVPADWREKRLRFALSLNPSWREAARLKGDEEVSFVPMEAVGEFGGLDLLATKPIAEIGSGYTYFADGDVVVAKITPCFENGKGALARGLRNGVAFGTTELHVLRAKPTELDSAYLFYLSISQPFRALGSASMYGAGGQKRVPEDFIKDFRWPLPPLAEQRAIAAFLNRKTARIDALVGKRRRLIQLLQEQRFAIVARTLTRGIHAGVALKESGLGWLGQVPAHWTVARLKTFGYLVGGAGFPHDDQGDSNQELPFYKVGDLMAASDGRLMTQCDNTVARSTARRLRAKVVPAGAVVYAKIGAALYLNRRRITTRNCCIDNNMTAFVPSVPLVSPEWSYYWLGFLDFGEFANPGAVPSLSEGYQSELPFVAPPLEEQGEITTFLDRETAKIDSMVAKVGAAIERLQEYRSALIAAAVTGDIDVRRETNGD